MSEIKNPLEEANKQAREELSSLTDNETEDQQEELTEEQLALKEQAQRMYLSEIMEQLTQSDRFKRFFEINYDVQTFFDDKEKTFNVRLIELPPELAASRLHQMAAKHAEDNMPKVQTATLDEIAAISEEMKKDGR